jgi:hypothetical protein
MIVELYDENDDWEAYRTSLQVYIGEAGYETYEPIVMLVVADPDGEPRNTDRVELKPNEGLINTQVTEYRPEEIVRLNIKSKLNGFSFHFYYSTR